VAQSPKQALKTIINLEGQSIYFPDLPFTVLAKLISTREF